MVYYIIKDGSTKSWGNPRGGWKNDEDFVLQPGEYITHARQRYGYSTEHRFSDDDIVPIDGVVPLCDWLKNNLKPGFLQRFTRKPLKETVKNSNRHF